MRAAIFLSSILLCAHVCADTPEEDLGTQMAVPAEFEPFTGAVTGNKVRLRLRPDLDAFVVRQLEKDTLLLIKGEQGDFWIAEPPADLKAYVFRSFVLENTIEGTNVNIRLAPDLEAPIIHHLSTGDRAQGIPSVSNNKWLEIPAPREAKLYISKEYIERKGSADLKNKMEKRRNDVQKKFDEALIATKTELKLPFPEIDIQKLTHNYMHIITEYKDIPTYLEQASSALAHLQETYLQKKTSYLEQESNTLAAEIEELSEEIAIEQEHLCSLINEEEPLDEFITDKMRMWEPVEESLYLTWAALNYDKSMADYYEEQHLTSIPLCGTLESYTAPVKNKPGDYILRDNNDQPIAYLYSTEINLEKMVGQHIKLLGSPRSNNNFAFPAYFVIPSDD